jgi:tetratricopeptide (TPR) repeat protein
MVQNYLKQIQKEFSHIKPHEEDDLEWWNEGLDLIDQGKLAEAEKKFKMLAVSQPDHSDGFEGLSKVYSKMNRIAEAKYFIDLAIEKVKKSIQSGYTDSEILDLMLDQQKAIERLSQ